MIQEKPHRIELLMFLAALFMLGAGIYFLGPSITGFVVKEYSYADDLGLVITSSGNYTWNLQSIGDLKSAMIDGRVTNAGKARVYIEENGKKYLVFDSARIGESKEKTIESNESGNSITGFATKDTDKKKDEKEDKKKDDEKDRQEDKDEEKDEDEKSDKDKKKKNKKPEWKGNDEFIINGTAAINLSQYFADKDGDALVYSASSVDGLEVVVNGEITALKPTASQDFNTTITFTASDGIDSGKETVKLIIIIKKEEPASRENRAPLWNSPVDTFIVNGSTSIDLSQYFADEDGDSLTYSSGLVDGIAITINNEIVSLLPAESYSGSASTAFSAYDGKNLTIKAIVLMVPEKLKANTTEPGETQPINGTNQTAKINNAPKWHGADEFMLNKTLSMDLLQYFADEDNDSLTFSVSDAADIAESISGSILSLSTSNDNFNATITITASDGNLSSSREINLIIPLTAASINETISKTIAINLDYKSGSVFDANDNGEESINGVVDLSVEGTKFNWDADKSKACTRWEVYNAEEESLTTFCNGNNDCCAFVGLLPSNANWSQAYYSAFGKDNAGHDNIVSAQVLYYDVNLSIDNPKSEIYYSSWANKSVKFFEEETEFFDECIETCSLFGLNKSSYTLVFEIEDDAVLRIDRIKYSMLADVANNPPLILQNFSTVNVSRNRNATINLSQYFADPDGDALSYSYYKPDNITIFFDGDIATIVPDRGISGERFTYLVANDSENVAVSGLFMINISEGKFKPKVEIGKAVKWQQKILVDVNNVSSVNLSLPETASNISISILNQTVQTELPDAKIKVVEDGKVKDKDLFELEKKLENLNKKIGILEEARQKQALRISVDEKEFEGNEIESKLDELYAKRAELEEQLGKLAPSGGSLITGNVVAITETTINDTLPTLFINESLARNIEISIEYETEAPISIEDEINSYTKQIKIVSETSYEDVLSYTTLNDVPQSAIKLYWVQNNEKVLFDNVDYIDENANGLIDRLEWLVPHLSNQTFEVSITVLNVQSYPTVGGNWTVGFNVTGTGNLTISAYNGTSYSEYYTDDSGTSNDLDILELKCNSTLLFNKNNLFNDVGIYLIDADDNRITIADTIGQQIPISAIYAENFNCDGLTAYWTVKVLTPGVHNQMFNFSNQIAEAHNFASAANVTTNGSVNRFVDDADTDFILGNFSTAGNLITSRVVGVGAGANVTANVSSLQNQTLNLPKERFIAPNASLVLLLHFEEGTGQYANDSSFYGNNATLGTTNAVAANDPSWNTTTKFGTFGMTFDGVNQDTLNITSSATLNFDNTNPFSIATWIKTGDTSPSAETALVSKNTPNPEYMGYNLVLANSGLTFYLVNDNNNNILNTQANKTNVNLFDNLWHYLVLTYDGSQGTSSVNFYIDGKNVGMNKSASSSTLSQSTRHNYDLMIGRTTYGGTDSTFNGTLDEFAIWNISLGNTTIEQFYQLGWGYFNSTNFTSRVFDAQAIVNWSYISWSQEANDKGVSNLYQSDISDLINSSTVLYMKFNNDTLESERQLNATHNISNEVNLVLYMPFDSANARELVPNGSTVLLMHFNNDTGTGENASLFLNNATNSTGGLPNGTCKLDLNACPVFNDSDTKFGKSALTFDGINDYVNATDITQLNSASAFTVTGWFKLDNVNSQRGMFEKIVDANNMIRARVWDDGFLYSYVHNGGSSYGQLSFPNSNLGQWFHYAMVFDGSGSANPDRLKVYINGANQPLTFAGTIPSSTANLAGASFIIGHNNSIGGGDNWDGSMDEVAVWNVSLSSQVIAQHAGYGIDRSIYGNNASLMNNSIVNASGKFAEAMQFDGTKSFINMSSTSINTGSGDSTYELWFNLKAHKNWNTMLFRKGGHMYFYGDNTGKVFTLCSGSPVSTNEWHHIAGVVKSGVGYHYIDGVLLAACSGIAADSNQPIFIGSHYSDNGGGIDEFTNGMLDEVALWNTSLSADKIAEHAGAKIVDYSQYGNNGTRVFNASPSFGQNFTDGKFSKALVFDGVNDYVNVSNSSFPNIGTTTDNYAVELWLKTSSANSGNYVANKRDSASTYPFVIYFPSPGGVPSMGVSDGANSPETSGGRRVDDNNWHHLVGIRDATNNLLQIFVDGIENARTTDTANDARNGDNVFIGGLPSTSSNRFNGQIDELSIWNISLSEAEIRRHYERGVLKLNLSYRTSQDNVTFTAWTGVSNNTISAITSNAIARYFQYKVDFNTTDPRYTPILNNVSINYSSRSNLTIFDDTELGVVIANDLFNFTVNFTDFVNPINGTNINCTLSHNGTGNWIAPVKMDYDAAKKVYWYNTSFTNKTIANFNVTCDGTVLGYQLMRTIDSFNVTAARVSSFNGTTTDYNNLAAFDNISNAVIEIIAFGKIAFLNPINATGADLNRNVNISANKVGMIPENLHRSLNTSANITISNVNILSNPQILKDGAICPSTVCTILNFTATNVTFNVTSFSNYSASNRTEPSINANFTVPTFPRFNRNVTIVVNVTDNNSNILSINFTIIAPNGTRFNLTNGSRVGDLYNASFNLTSYGTWYWNLSVYDSDGFIVNMTGTGQIILLQLNMSLNLSAVLVGTNVAVAGHINISNGSNVSNNPIDIFLDESNINFNITNPTRKTVLYDTDTDFLTGNISVNAPNSTSRVIGTGAGANVTINISSRENQTLNMPRERFVAPNASLVAYYRFEEGTGQYANDSSLYQQANGTLGSTTAAASDDPSWNTTTKFGSFGLSFDGSNDYLNSTRTYAQLGVSKELTLEAWVRLESSGDRAIFGDSNGDILLGFRATEVISAHRHSTVTTNYDMPSLNEWHHIAATYSDVRSSQSDTIGLWLDGVRVNETTGTNSADNPLNEQVSISTRVGTDFFFDGTIDEAAIWNVSLDNATILSHYQLGWGYFNKTNFTSQVFDAQAIVNWSYISWSQEANDKGVSNLYQSDISDLINASTVLYMKFNNDTLESERQLNVTHNISNEPNLVLYMPFDSASATELKPNISTVLLMHFNNDTGTGENASLFLNNATYGNGTGLGNISCESAFSCPTFNDSDTRFGKSALLFNGSQSLNGSSFTYINSIGTRDFSLELWFKTVKTGKQMLIYLVENPLESDIELRLFGNPSPLGALLFRTRAGNTNSEITTSQIYNDGQWHHVVATRSLAGTLQKIYVDGAEVVSSTVTARDVQLDNDPSFLIGDIRLSGDPQNFNGTLDEVAIWNISLSSADIAKHSGYGIDRSRYGNNVTKMFGNLTVNSTNSKFGEAMQFKELTSFINISNDTGGIGFNTFNSSAKFTAEMWVYPASLDASGANILVGSFGNPGRRGPFEMRLQGSKANIFSNGGGAGDGTVTGATNLPLNRWTHIAATDDNVTLKIYLNGVLDGSGSAGTNGLGNAASFIIGPEDASGSTRYNLTMDEFALWNISLPSDKIAEHAGAKIIDYSQYGNNGTRNFNSTSDFGRNFTDGKFSKALVFDGVNDFINISNTSSLSIPSGSYTYSAWVNAKGLAANKVFLEKGIPSAGARVSLGIDNTGTKFQWGPDGGSTLLNSGTTVSTNTWYHVVGTFDGTIARLYVNGLQENLAAVTGNYAGTVVFIGANAVPNLYWDGLIDEAAIWNISLSADEIRKHYERGVLKLNLSYRTSNDSITFSPWVAVTNNTLSLTSIGSAARYFQYKADFNTTDPRYTPILNNVSINYSGIFTDSYGNFNYTFVAPTAAGTHTIKVNTTYANISGEASQSFGTEVNAAPNAPIQNAPASGAFINVNYTILNITISDNNTFAQSFTCYFYGDNSTLPNGTINISNPVSQNGTAISFNWSNLNQSTYFWKANCQDDSLLGANSTIRNFTIDTIFPRFNFTLPTDANNTFKFRNFTYINFSVTEINPNTFIVNWNGTNVTVWDDSLLMNVRFNNDTSIGEDNNYFADSTYYNNSFVCSGTTCPSVNKTFKRLGQAALTFDGIDDYINSTTISSFGSFILNRSHTMSMWINIAGGTGRRYVLADYNAAGGVSTVEIEINGANILTYLLYDINNNNFGECTNALNNNTWYHIAATWDRANVRLYVNGHNINTGCVEAGTSIRENFGGATLKFAIGRPGLYNDLFFNGTIDEVRIYSRNLSAQEINASMNAEFGRYFFNQTEIREGFYSYYGYLNDSAGNSNTTETRRFEVDRTFPRFNFTLPTDANNTFKFRNFTYINFSVIETNPNTFIVNWNGTNVTVWDDSLVLHMHFNNDSSLGENDSLFADVSRYNNTGICNSSASCPIINKTLYKFGGAALTFNGSAFVNVSNPPSLNGMQRLTLSTWIYFNGFGQDQAIIGKYLSDPPGQSSYLLQVLSGSNLVRFVASDGTNRAFIDSTTAISTGRWYYLTAVYNGNNQNGMDIYINGVKDAVTLTGTISGAVSSSTLDLIIGARHNSAALQQYMNATIDELRIYNRNISGQEINASMNVEFGRYFFNQTEIREGFYNYYGYLNDSAGNSNTTETRRFEVDRTFPRFNFTGPTDTNNTITQRNFTYINFSVTEINPNTFIVNWNGTNVTAFDDSLVLHMHFNNDSSLGESDVVFADVSRYNNTGTCSGSTCPVINKTNYKFGASAITLDGLDDFVDVSDSNSLDVTRFTVALWFYTIDTKISVIASKWTQAGNDRSWALTKDSSNKINYVVDQDGDAGTLTSFASNAAIGLNRWHYAVITYNGTNGSIYIDGVLDISKASVTPFISTSNVRIGRDGAGQYFNGTVDEFRVYSRALSGAEINASMNAEFGRYFFNQTEIREGFYNYYGYLNDSAGNSNTTETRLFTVDRTAPRINFTSPTPANNSRAKGNIHVINISIIDTNTISSCTLQVYNGTFSATNFTMQIQGLNCNVTINAVDGYNYTLKAYVNDSAGNFNSTENLTFRENTAPDIPALNAPSNSSRQITTSVLLNYSTNDNDTDAVNYIVYFDTNTDPATQVYIGTSKTLIVSAARGTTYYWKVQADDSYENSSNSTIRKFTVNTVPQIPDIITPNTTGIKLRGSQTYNISWVNSTSDAEGDNVTVNLYYSTDSGLTFPNIIASGLRNNGTYDWPVPSINSNKVRIKAIANDSFEFTEDISENDFIIDSSAPVITLDNPPNLSSFNNGTFINLTITDNLAGGINASWNNNSYPNAPNRTDFNGTFDINTTGWGVGDVNITIYANDSVGNSISAYFRFTVTNVQPVVTFNTPSPNQVIMGTFKVNVSATAQLDDVAFVNFTYEGATQNFTMTQAGTDYFYNFDTATVTDGQRRLSVYANDSAGNVVRADIFATIDNTKPAVRLDAPANDTWRNASVAFVYTPNDVTTNIANCSLRINGTINQSNASISKGIENIFANVVLGDGIYRWDVNCTDSAGNNNSNGTFRIIKIDTIAPIITLIDPPNDTSVRGNKTINFSVSDSGGSNVNNVTWSSNFLLGQTDFIGAYGINTSLFPEGRVNLTITANDSAGNKVTMLFSYVIDLTPPLTTINKPTPLQVIRGIFRVNVSATDALSNVSGLTFAFNGSQNFTMSRVSPEVTSDYFYDWNTSNTSGDKEYIIKIFGNDTAANIKFESRFAVVDNTAPAVRLDAPANDTWNRTRLVLFTFTMFELHDLNNCTLIINGSINATKTESELVKNSTNIFSVNLSDGNYRWTVNCSDEAVDANGTRNLGTNTTEYLISVDASTPQIAFVSPPTEANDTHFARNFTAVNVTIAEANFANMTFYLYNRSSLINETNFTTATYFLNFTRLRSGLYFYNVSIRDRANNINTTETRQISLNERSPSSRKFSITNSSGDAVASIDDKGDMYLLGNKSQALTALNATPSSFVVQNSSANAVAYINSTGFLFLKGALTEDLAITLAGTNLEIRDSNDRVVAVFDSQGNLKLTGLLVEKYITP